MSGDWGGQKWNTETILGQWNYSDSFTNVYTNNFLNDTILSTDQSHGILEHKK